MSAETIARVLQEHPFSKGLWPGHIARLAPLAGEMRFGAGDLIFKEGDHSSLFYLIVSGNVALEVVASGHPVRIATLYAGEALGWSSVTRKANKQFQARALEDVFALGFDGARLAHACEDDYALGFWFMRAIVDLMSERLQAVRSQLVDTYTPVAITVGV